MTRPAAGSRPRGAASADQRGLTDWLPRRLAAAEPSITVIGDVMLDGWWSGSIERLCREAPAPVVEISQRKFAPGGAANTAMNLTALGAKVRLAGIAGCDDAAAELFRQLRGAGVDTSLRGSGGRCDDHHQNPHQQQRPGALPARRCPGGAPAGALEPLARSIPQVLQDQHAVVVCDYGAGALSGPVRSGLVDVLPGRSEVLVVVDAHQPRAWAGAETRPRHPERRGSGRHARPEARRRTRRGRPSSSTTATSCSQRPVRMPSLSPWTARDVSCCPGPGTSTGPGRGPSRKSRPPGPVTPS